MIGRKKDREREKERNIEEFGGIEREREKERERRIEGVELDDIGCYCLSNL